MHRSPGVQSWRRLVSTSGLMCSRSERSPVAAELVPDFALRRCDLVLWHSHLYFNLDSASLRASRVPLGRHCFLGCGCLLRPLGLRVWLPFAPPRRCGFPLRPRSVASHLLPPLACPRGRVSLRLLLSHAGVVARFAPLCRHIHSRAVFARCSSIKE